MKYANRPLALLVAGALVVTLAGCSNSAVSTLTESSAAGTVLSATESEFSLEGATAFTFTDSGISAAEGDYNGYTIEGTALTISAAGTYVVSGSCADGSITVEAGTEDVTLILNGLELTSTTTAPIVCGKSTGVTIAVQSGTRNTLADTAANNKDSENASADAESAVLKCKDGAQVRHGKRGQGSQPDHPGADLEHRRPGERCRQRRADFECGERHPEHLRRG